MKTNVIPLVQSSPTLVLNKSTGRSGFTIENLSSTPILVRAQKAPALADVVGVLTITPSKAPTKGTFKIKCSLGTTTALAYNAANTVIQAALRLLNPSMGALTVSGTMATAVVVTLTSCPVPFGPMEVVESTLGTVGVASVQLLQFTSSIVPDGGTYRLKVSKKDTDGNYRLHYESNAIAANAAAATIQAELRSSFKDATLTVTGTWGDGFTITFGELKEVGLIQVFDNLATGGPSYQTYLVSNANVPDAGGFKLLFGELTSDEIAFDDNAAAIQVILRDMEGLEEVTVTGDWTEGFVITAIGITDIELLEAGFSIGDDTLEFEEAPSEVTVEGTGEGYLAKEKSVMIVTGLQGADAGVVTAGRAVVTTPGDVQGLNETIASMSTLDKKGIIIPAAVYCYTAGASVSVKVTEY